MNSAYNTSYIGSTASRIYLVYYTALNSTGNGKTIIYWTEKKNLSKRQISEIIKNKDYKISQLNHLSDPFQDEK